MSEIPSRTLRENVPPITEVLKAVEDGRFAVEASRALVDLTREMSQIANATGGKPSGKIVISMSIKLDGGIFEVLANVETKRPKKNRMRTVMWEGRDGALVPENPRQLTLGQIREGGRDRAAGES